MFTHSKNSHFQYVYFLAGKCHTADEAYRVLKDQLEDRELALESNEDKVLKSDKHGQELLSETRREIAFIKGLIETLQPYRRYKHLPDHEAMQACQREEWGLELLQRAQNFLLSGTIPADQIDAMRMHPDWETFLLPSINQMIELRSRGQIVPLPRPDFLTAITKLLPEALPPRYPRLMKVETKELKA